MAEITDLRLGLKNRGRRFLEHVGMEFMERVKEKTPVRTGHLQNSWGFTKRADDIEVYNVAEYASFVNDGTVSQAPKRMLERTVAELPAIVEVALERTKK